MSKRDQLFAVQNAAKKQSKLYQQQLMVDKGDEDAVGVDFRAQLQKQRESKHMAESPYDEDSAERGRSRRTSGLARCERMARRVAVR